MRHPAYTLLLLPIPLILIFLMLASRPVIDTSETASIESVLLQFGISNPEIRSFSADMLADYINGAADAYIEAGFELCTVWEGSVDDTEVILERYSMTSKEAAESILSLEGGEFLSEEAFAFTCSHYYFKGILFSEDPEFSVKTKERILQEVCR